nr:RNA-dependent RNA polymerase [Flumine noda-like virus 46]
MLIDKMAQSDNCAAGPAEVSVGTPSVSSTRGEGDLKAPRDYTSPNDSSDRDDSQDCFPSADGINVQRIDAFMRAARYEARQSLISEERSVLRTVGKTNMPPTGDYQLVTPWRTLRFRNPSISQLSATPRDHRIVFTQLMPVRPAGDTHTTRVGPNPYFDGYGRSLGRSLAHVFGYVGYVEPPTVELVEFEKPSDSLVESGTIVATPVIDLTGRLLAINHVGGVQLYRVTVLRQDQLLVTAILDPIETFRPCCKPCSLFPRAGALEQYMIHYRESSFSLEGYGNVHALGYRTESYERFVSLQVAAYKVVDIPYNDYINVDLRNGTKHAIASVEHNLSVLKSYDPVREAPDLAMAIKAHVRIQDFPCDGTSMLEGGDGFGYVVKLDPEVCVNAEDADPPVKLLPSLAVQETGVIAKTVQAVKEAEAERVAPYLNDKSPPDWIVKARKEFLDLLLPPEIAGTVVPLSVEESRELDRPNQARKFDQKEHEAIKPDPEAIKLFLKTEPVDPASASRFISDPDDFLRVFSRMFGEPLTRVLKESTFMRDHYGFIAPKKLEALWERLLVRAKKMGYTTETDFSKMDATVNMWMREMEEELGERAFHKDYHELWKIWHSKLYAKPDSKKLKGISVHLGASRRSGEYFTSLFNTILNMFYICCCFVYMGMTMAEAIEECGLVGGDDGLHPNLPVEVATKVADMLGFIAKAASVDLGAPTSFLGLVRFKPRVYCYDPIRFCSKMSSISTGANVPPEEAAIRKFTPMADLYPRVPLVGTISRAVLRIIKSKRSLTTDEKYDVYCRGKVGSYLATLWKEEAQANDEENIGLPFEIDEGEALGLVSIRLGISLVTLEIIEKRYEAAKSFKEFPSHILDLKCHKKEFKYPTIFQGDVYKGSAPTKGGTDKNRSSLITKDQEPLASRAPNHNATKSKESTSSNSSCSKAETGKKPKNRRPKRARATATSTPASCETCESPTRENK